MTGSAPSPRRGNRRRAALQVLRFLWLQCWRQVRHVGRRWHRQFRDAPLQWRRQVTQRGPVRYATPWVAWARFWTRGLVWSGRASWSEYWWCIALEAALTAIATLAVPEVLPSLPHHWAFSAHPFGPTTSPTVDIQLLVDRASGTSYGLGNGRTVSGDPWDWALVVLVVLTALPRWSLLVRRLHDVGRSGYWVVAVWVFPVIGSLVVWLLVLQPQRPRGVRFDTVRPLGVRLGGRIARSIAQRLRRTRTGSRASARRPA